MGGITSQRSLPRTKSLGDRVEIRIRGAANRVASPGQQTNKTCS
jgi:hypothetical protein